MKHLLSLLFLSVALLLLVDSALSAPASSGQDNCLPQLFGQGLRVLFRHYLGKSSSKDAAESDEEKQEGKHACETTKKNQANRDTANAKCALLCVNKSKGKFGRCARYVKHFAATSNNPCVCSDSEKFQGDTLCGVTTTDDRNGANKLCAAYCTTKEKTHGRCRAFRFNSSSKNPCECDNSPIFKPRLVRFEYRCDFTVAGLIDCDHACVKSVSESVGVCVKKTLRNHKTVTFCRCVGKDDSEHLKYLEQFHEPNAYAKVE